MHFSGGFNRKSRFFSLLMMVGSRMWVIEILAGLAEVGEVIVRFV